MTTGYEFWRAGGPYVRVLHRDGSQHDLKGLEVANAMQAWPFWAARPISENDYNHFREHRHFPDEVEEVPEVDPRQHADPFEVLLDQVRSVTQLALSETKGDITTKLEADRAANWRDRLLELQKRCDVAAKAEKKPYEDQLKAIRDRWKVPDLELTNAIAFIRNALTPYLKADREAARAAAPTVEAKPKVGTGRRRTGLRTHVSAKINDWQAAAIALLENQDLRAEIQRLADRVYRAGGELPGCEKVEKETAQ